MCRPTDDELRARGFVTLPSTGNVNAFAIGLPQPRHMAAQQAVIDALAPSLGRPPTASEIVLALARTAATASLPRSRAFLRPAKRPLPCRRAELNAT